MNNQCATNHRVFAVQTHKWVHKLQLGLAVCVRLEIAEVAYMTDSGQTITVVDLIWVEMGACSGAVGEDASEPELGKDTDENASRVAYWV
jgi:hypothetical protein